nr:uncharacterized protein LOC107451896 isoform X1 [Parasteatoda tepidariorum]
MCDLSASIFLMNRSFYCVEIFILMILYYIGGNSPPKSIFKCSRIKSRLVRLIINKRVSPVLNRYKLNFPLTCPFHNDRDILWWPDIQFHFQDGQWICPYCGQIFPSEITLTEHWDSEHMDNEIEDAVCLANFCDIFRCEVILAALEVEKNTYAWEKISKFQYPLNRAPCDEKKMRSLQKKCKVIMRHCLLGLLSSLSTKDFQDIEGKYRTLIS